MAQFTTLTSRVVPLPINDVDTDQIIPARFLKATDKKGMGANLFADWRYNADGSPKPDFVLNQPDSAGCQILLAGDNFGCGSSREHAPWALTGFGFRAVISTSIADIFRNNALKNGLIPIIVDKETHKMLFDIVEEIPHAEFTVDLASQTLSFPNGSVSFPIDPFNKTCLLNGVDELGYILGFEKEIAEFEAREGNKAAHMTLPSIQIYDTTLRDGTQSEGFTLSSNDKVRIAQRLDSLGMAFIEGGWPGSNPKDVEFFERARDIEWKRAQIAAFGSTCRVKGGPEDDANIKALIDSHTPRLHHFWQDLEPSRNRCPAHDPGR